MALSKEQINSVEEVLKASLRNKFQNYKPEPASMPFHTRLLGKDRLALYSFIHSLNTNFGTSIFEPVGLALAQKHFKMAISQATAGDQIKPKFRRLSMVLLQQQVHRIKKKKLREYGKFARQAK